MELATTDEGGAKVMEISGSLDTGTAPEAQEALLGLVEGGSHKIVVDLTGLDYISSAGLRILLLVAKRLMAVSGELKICGLNETVQEVFDISGFSSIFSVFDSKDSALS